MSTPKLKTGKLKEAVEKFGSLENAVEALQTEKFDLEKQNNKLAQEVAKLRSRRDALFVEIVDVENNFGHQKKQLKACSELVQQYDRQHELFESFLAMITGSPSITGSIEGLIALYQQLLDSGWHTSKSTEELRSLFVRTVMGDFLKSFRCDGCGARFLINREPRYKSISNYYVCPACHYHMSVKADSSFMEAMLSQGQLEDIYRVEQLQKENDALRPLKVFLDLPCEVCGHPVTEWTLQDVKRGVTGLGWGHSACWSSDKGHIRQFFRLAKEELERRV